MNIGLDFDGVITNCGKLKSEVAKKIYGIDVPPEKTTKELIISSGLLTPEQYGIIQEQAYSTRELGLSMSPVDEVLYYLPKLQDERHNIKIITSRGKLESQIAKEWMEQRGISIPIISVGYRDSKTEACKGSDVYIDDFLDKIKPLIDIVPHRFLFTWGYNKHIEVESFIAQRISSWKEFYDEIQKIAQN